MALALLLWGQTSMTVGGSVTYVTGESMVVATTPAATYTLQQPTASSSIFGVAVYVNGIRQTTSVQYSRISTTITFVTPVAVGATILVDYVYQ